MKNSLTILGTSSGLPQPNRACSGYLLKVGQSCSLIDCGGGVTSSFLKTGFDSLAVDRIFISHTHPDHVCELPLFIQLVYLRGRTKRLDVYVPNEFENPLMQYLYSVYLIRERLPFELKIIGYEHRFEFYGNFNLDAYETRHLHKYSEEIRSLNLPNKMQAHCFVMEIDNKRVFYSGDIESFSEIKGHLDGCEYALIESTHIEILELLDYAPKANVGNFIITHLGTPANVNEIEKSVKDSGVKNVCLGHDGMVLPL
jgi:ribonuclease BN (tRNA processing enzyme)